MNLQDKHKKCAFLIYLVDMVCIIDSMFNLWDNFVCNKIVKKMRVPAPKSDVIAVLWRTEGYKLFGFFSAV